MPTTQSPQNRTHDDYMRQAMTCFRAWETACIARIRASKNKDELRSLSAKLFFMSRYIGFLLMECECDSGMERLRNFLALQTGERPAKYGVTLLYAYPADFEVFINDIRDFDFEDAYELSVYTWVKIRKLDGRPWKRGETARLARMIQDDIEFDDLLCDPDGEIVDGSFIINLNIVDEDYPEEP